MPDGSKIDMVQGKLRYIVKKVHLYIGLWFGAIFVMLGLTGSLIAWLPELDAALNPELLRSSTASSTDTPLRLSTRTQAVIDKLSADQRYGRPTQLWLPVGADDVFIAWYSAGKSKNTSSFKQKISRQVMVDPQTLQIKGERNWGEAGISRPLFMPTLFHLHHYLLAGDAGKLLLATAGTLLLVLAAFGMVLWWPHMKLQSIRQALRIAHGGSWGRFNYSSHRALGFYAAPIFLVVAISGIYFTAPGWVVPVVERVMTVSLKDKPKNESPAAAAPITAAAAMEIAENLYPNADIMRIALPAGEAMPFEIRVRQKEEIQDGGATRMMIDSRSGKLLRTTDPLRASSGDLFLSWLFPLHSGQFFGIAGKVFVSLFGLMPLFFAITGISIWLKRTKNAGRNSARTAAWL